MKSLKRDGTKKTEMEHKKIQGWERKNKQLAALKMIPVGSFQGANSNHPQRTASKDKTRSLERPQNEGGTKTSTHNHQSQKTFDFVHGD